MTSTLLLPSLEDVPVRAISRCFCVFVYTERGTVRKVPTGGRENANVAVAPKVISATSHTHKHDMSERETAAQPLHTKSPPPFFFRLHEPSHTSSTWSGASRLPRSEPRPLSSRLHFTLSVLSLCLTTRWSMLTVSLLGGERDREIKFILNSFPLMWQLHPPPSPLLSSPSGTARSLFQSTSRLCFVHRKRFLPPGVKTQTEMACLSFNLRRIRWVRSMN